MAYTNMTSKHPEVEENFHKLSFEEQIDNMLIFSLGMTGRITEDLDLSCNVSENFAHTSVYSQHKNSKHMMIALCLPWGYAAIVEMVETFELVMNCSGGYHNTHINFRYIFNQTHPHVMKQYRKLEELHMNFQKLLGYVHGVILSVCISTRIATLLTRHFCRRIQNIPLEVRSIEAS